MGWVAGCEAVVGGDAFRGLLTEAKQVGVAVVAAAYKTKRAPSYEMNEGGCLCAGAGIEARFSECRLKSICYFFPRIEMQERFVRVVGSFCFFKQDPTNPTIV